MNANNSSLSKVQVLNNLARNRLNWIKNRIEIFFIITTLNYDRHWSLLLICNPMDCISDKGCFMYLFDSMNIHNSKNIYQTMKHVIEIAVEAKTKNTFSGLKFECRDNLVTEQQTNGYDCGLYVLFFVEELVNRNIISNDTVCLNKLNFYIEKDLNLNLAATNFTIYRENVKSNLDSIRANINPNTLIPALASTHIHLKERSSTSIISTNSSTTNINSSITNYRNNSFFHSFKCQCDRIFSTFNECITHLVQSYNSSKCIDPIQT